MLKVNEKKLKDMKINANDFYIISDFDNTITDSNSHGSLNVITKSQLLGEEYYKRYLKIVDEYEEKAKNTIDIELKKELWFKHLNEYMKMLKKYNLTKDLLENIIKTSNIKFRKNFDVFIKYLHSKNIPLIIISSGLGNSIEMFLKMNNLYYDNVYIISNFVEFAENGNIITIPQNVITPVTKNEIVFNDEINLLINNKKNKIIFGDIPDDICMSKINEYQNTLSIAFCNYNYMFDDLCNKFDFVIKDGNIFKLLEDVISEDK